MSERDEAIALANRMLDRFDADPDDDLAILARQFIRETERAAAAERDAERYRFARDECERLKRELAEAKEREGAVAYTSERGWTPLGQHIVRLEAERDAEKARAAAAERDAERYRHLRESGASIDPDTLHWKRNKWLDDAVDKAIVALRERRQT